MIGPPATMANRLSSQRMSEEWPDQDYIPRDPPVNPSPNLSVSDGNWSDIQRWYQENHTHEQGLSPPPRNRQPRVEDYDEDYLRYLQDIPEEEEDEEDFIHSSVQENETGYTPRPPKYDSDTMECLVKKKQKKVNSSKAEDTQAPTSVDEGNSDKDDALPLSRSLSRKQKPKELESSKHEPSDSNTRGLSYLVPQSQVPQVQPWWRNYLRGKKMMSILCPNPSSKGFVQHLLLYEPPRPPIDASKKDSPDDSSNSSGLNDSDANHNENQPKEEDESRRIEDESNIAENKGQSTHAMSSPPRGVAEQRNEEIIFAAPLAVILPQICDVTHDPTISKTEELAQQSDSDEKAAKYLLELIITSS
nr:hypothetical protein Iba_chr06cCG10740 [Ipomoea batatas]